MILMNDDGDNDDNDGDNDNDDNDNNDNDNNDDDNDDKIYAIPDLLNINMYAMLIIMLLI